MTDHYREIWKRLDKSRFVIGLAQRMDSGSEEFDLDTRRYSNELLQSGYPVMDVSELRRSGIRFQWVISNHIIASAQSLLGRRHRASPMSMLLQFLRRPTWLPQELGNCQIRMMYGADLNDAWSLRDWNKMYSYVLCHGPQDAELFRQRFKGVCFEIGYPKYDRHFLERGSLSSSREAFNLAAEPKVVLWLPTAGKNSLDEFFGLIAALTDHYQVICRPHPISIRTQTESVSRLQASPITLDTYDSREMVDLLGIADYLLVDSGGSPFGGLYLDMKVVRLVGPISVQQEYAVDSTNDALVNLYPSISPCDSLDSVIELLEDDDLWNEVRISAKELRGQVFANYDGCSANRAVSVLEQITGLELGVAKRVPTASQT